MESSDMPTVPPAQEPQPHAAQQPGGVPQGGAPQPVYYQPAPEQLLMDWTAPSRVHQRRTREYYSSLLVIVFLLSLILFFAGQLLLIAVLWSFLFITYVLATVSAENIRVQLTTYGVRYNGKLYYWGQLGRFWIRKNGGIEEIHIEAPVFLGSELILLPGTSAENGEQLKIDDLSEMLSRFLVYEEPLPSQIDHWVQWIQEKFPLDGRRTPPPRRS